MSEPVAAYAALQLIPTLQGLGSSLDRQLTAPLASAGRSAGQAAGRAIASGLESARAAVERASGALAAARDKEADAAGKVRVAEAKLEELRRKGNASASQLARAEEALAHEQRAAQRAAANTQRAVQSLSDARADLANTTDDAEQSEGRFSSAVSGMTSRLGPAAKQMLALGAATAGVGSAISIASAAISKEALSDKLTAQLDVGPDKAAELGGISGRLYADAYGEGLADVNNAIKGVWQQGLVDEDAATAEIESVTSSVLNLANAFEQDAASISAAVGTMLKTGIAGSASEAMDILTRGFKLGADKGGDLLDSFTEYSVQFKAMGLDAAETTGLMSQALGSGARNADLVVDALKEFTLQMQGGGEATRQAISDLGFSDVDAVLARFANGGEDAQAAFSELQTALLATEDPLARNSAALGLYGTKYEDMQSAIFALDPASAVDSLGQIDGAAAEFGDTLRDNTDTALKRLTRSVQGGFVGGLTSAAGWVEENKTLAIGFAAVLGTVATAIGVVKVATIAWNAAQTIAAAGTKIWTGIQWLWNAAMTANPIGLIVVGIAALVAGIVLAYQKSETFREIVSTALNVVKTAALWLWENALQPFVEWWVTNAAKSWAAFTMLGEKAGEAKDWIVEKFTALVSWLGELPSKVTNTLSGLWTGLTTGFKTALNSLISMWNNFRLTFDFEIPVINKRIQFVVDTPDLPLLARGGTAGVDGSGRIFGPGSGTSDSILALGADGVPTAMVSAGEGVVRKSAMDNGGADLVAALNAGWVPPLNLLRAMLPGLAEGGLTQAQDWARGQAGKPYQYGGVGNPSWDCSGFMSGIYATIAGKDPNTRHFTTESDFEALGFKPGLGDSTDFSIGVRRGGGGNLSHMAGTLGDLNVESGGDGVEVGSGAMGAADFPLQWHRPVLGDSGDALTNGGTNAGGGLGSGGGGTSGGGGASGGGAGSGGGTRPAGDAVAVWVDNWPSGFGTSTGSTPSTTVGGDGVDAVYNDPAATSTDPATTTQEQGTHPLQGAPGTGDLFNGPAPWWLASSPEQAGANLTSQAGSQLESTITDVQGFFSGDNLKEMLGTLAGVAGMGAVGGRLGGDTINITNTGMSPEGAAKSVERVLRRRTMIQQRTGGFTR